MAKIWKEVTNTGLDIKKHKDVTYEGEYKGKREISTKIGKQFIYEFVDEDGAKFGIYGFTNLNRAMEGVAEGQMCRITYLGTENVETKFGMKDVHQVRVEVETEDEPVEPLKEPF